MSNYFFLFWKWTYFVVGPMPDFQLRIYSHSVRARVKID